jgi:putative heme iron utilization protein
MTQIDPIEFIEQFDTLMISSISSNQKPHSSYAPFVSQDKQFYICISKMAKHTNNLLKTESASIMFIEDESESTNSFARKRVTFDVDVLNIQREEEKFSEIMQLFNEKFGEKASMYEQMADFYLFEFTPFSGRAVFGFGAAYNYKEGAFKNLMGG